MSAKGKPKKPIVDFQEPTKNKLPESEPIDNILNIPVIIEDVEFFPSRYKDNLGNPISVIHIITQDGKRYRAVSSVLEKQLRDIKNSILQQNALRCKIVKIRRYYTITRAE